MRTCVCVHAQEIIYIYIYMRMYVCVCVSVLQASLILFIRYTNFKSMYVWKIC